MTTTRAVKISDHRTRTTPDGSTLVLACGHSVWVGGLYEIPITHECIMGPCHQHVQAMGNEDTR